MIYVNSRLYKGRCVVLNIVLKLTELVDGFI